jgi:hypothetical protein
VQGNDYENFICNFIPNITIMKKYKIYRQMTRREQQRITGGWRSNTYCFGFMPGHGSFATLVATNSCNPELCCTAIPNPYGYSCGQYAGYAEFLDCGGGFEL